MKFELGDCRADAMEHLNYCSTVEDIEYLHETNGYCYPCNDGMVSDVTLD